MPTPAVVREYRQPTCTLKLEGSSLPEESAPVWKGRIHSELELILSEGKSKLLVGDNALVQDLITVMERYLQSYLRGEPQGMFSSTVAIRPLDFLFHRLTVRQGDGIGQIDLSMTQLYDLTEILQDLVADIPQVKTAKSTPTKAWYAQPASVAAMFVGVVGVAAAVAVWSGRQSESEQAVRQEGSPTTALIDAAPRDKASGDPLATQPTAKQSEPDSGNQELAANESTVSRTVPEAPKPTESLLDQASALTVAGSRLQQRLQRAWLTPPTFSGEWIYRVTVDADGIPITALPQDQVSADNQAETPLSALPTAPPATTADPSETFVVRFLSSDRVTLEPAQ